MSRELMAILVSSAMVFGGVSTSAWSATSTSNEVQTPAVQTADVARNQSPLPPAGAAGIKEAQGFENSPWLGLGLVAAAVIIAWVLLDDESDDSTPSTN